MTAVSTTSELNYDPWDRDTSFNPHPIFRRLREEAPLYYNEEKDFYALSRFDDVERAHVNHETFISSRGVTLDLLKSNMQIPPGTVILEDPPTHTIHRSLLSRMFTPRRVSELEPKIRQFCANRLDPLVGSGGFDLILHVGKQVPMSVISMLVGIPEADQEAIRDHFDDTRKVDHEDRDDALTGTIFADYIDWRADHPSDDIMTQLMYSEFQDETGTVRRLTRAEVLAYVNIVAAAGNETTRLMVGWTGKLMADHPDQRKILVDDPSLIPNAVEEIVRFEPPNMQACRYVAREIELHGQTVPVGSSMAMLMGSANRDDEHFADPDRFDVTRRTKQMFTFGFGSHYCLGQALARLEGRIVLEELLKRFPNFDVDWDQSEFDNIDSDLRGWEKLQIVTP